MIKSVETGLLDRPFIIGVALLIVDCEILSGKLGEMVRAHFPRIAWDGSLLLLFLRTFGDFSFGGDNGNVSSMSDGVSIGRGSTTSVIGR